MTNLEKAMIEFNNKQIAKFYDVEKKHPENSVTKDDSAFWRKSGIDETQINNADSLISQLEYHLVEEICEYFGQKDLTKHFMYMINSERHKLNLTNEYQANECIDISNLSFLIWVLKR